MSVFVFLKVLPSPPLHSESIDHHFEIVFCSTVISVFFKSGLLGCPWVDDDVDVDGPKCGTAVYATVFLHLPNSILVGW